MSIKQQLEAYMRGSGKSAYRICKDTGLDQAAMSRFLSGKQGFDLSTIDKLADYLDLELTHRKPPSNKFQDNERKPQ